MSEMKEKTPYTEMIVDHSGLLGLVIWSFPKICVQKWVQKWSIS